MQPRISHWDGEHWVVVVDNGPNGTVEMTLDELFEIDPVAAGLLVDDDPAERPPQPMSPGA